MIPHLAEFKTVPLISYAMPFLLSLYRLLNQYPQCDESITLKLEYTVYIVFRNPHDPEKGSI